VTIKLTLVPFYCYRSWLETISIYRLLSIPPEIDGTLKGGFQRGPLIDIFSIVILLILSIDARK